MGYNFTMEIFLTFGKEKRSVSYGTTPFEILDDLAKSYNVEAEDIYAVLLNNRLCSLREPIRHSARLEPVFASSAEGASVYRSTLCFVLAAASHMLFPQKRLLVGHSLGHGYYYTFDDEDSISNDELDLLWKQMQKIIDSNEVIRQDRIPYEEAIDLFDKLNLTKTRKQLNFVAAPNYRINKIDEFSDLYTTPLLPSTGLLHVFELKKFGSGFLLRFPPSRTPKTLKPISEHKQLFLVYERYKNWGKKLDVTSVADLNELVCTGNFTDFMDICETLQNKCFSDAAEMIYSRKNVRLVLIAGPSSSGKTTSSKKIAMQLRVRGFIPKVISLDDYYIGRDDTPKDEDGNYDYECLEALRVEQLNKDLLDLFSGKEVEIPNYDFTIGKYFYDGKKKLHLNEHDILIIEGIHGLNDKLTHLISGDEKFKIYVSALTQLNLDDHTRVSTRDNRLIRRIVRDSWHRGKTASQSIGMWPSVQKGEVLHIFPFQNNADVMINTALDYELSVLKVYAEPLLRCVPPTDSAYTQASHLLAFLDNFLPIPDTMVPKQSLLREFIGGSSFKY